MDDNNTIDDLPRLVEGSDDEVEEVKAESSKCTKTQIEPVVTSTLRGRDTAFENSSHLKPGSSNTSLSFSAYRSNNRYPLHTPAFKRIDFSDLSDALVEERKPAWKLWQDSIKDSYYKVRKNAQKSVEETAFNDSQLMRRREKNSVSPTEELSIPSPFAQRSSHLASYLRSPFLHRSTGPVAAPAVSSSQGIEERYNDKVNDIEARLLKTSILPNSVKSITMHDFRNGPNPAPGSVSETLIDDTDYQTFLPRPYYSRPNRNDPDYFDFDLQHSVNLFKRPEGKYVPKGPQTWEEKLLRESNSKGDAPLSAYMFTKSKVTVEKVIDSVKYMEMLVKGDTDWRTAGTSYLSAALRTPSFWEHRFESIGREVRDSNPISFDSLARNKPVPNRFTEYHDPDYEDLSDFEDKY